MKNDNILVVEDDAIAQLTLAQYLKDLGFPRSLAVNNGPEALSIVQRQAITMVFLDIRIVGEWDGVETARQIREIYPDLPLVFLTANTDRGTMRRIQQIAPQGVVRKPYDRKILKQAIETAIGTHTPNTEVDEKDLSDLPLIQPTRVGMSVTDVDGTLLAVNTEFCRIHACQPADAVGQPFMRYFPETIRGFATALHHDFMAGDTEEGGGPWFVLDAKGDTKEVLIEVQRVPASDGTFHKISLFTDKAQQDSKTQRLQHMLEARDTFVRELHHRIKNNLNVISGLFYLQSEKIKDQPDVYSLFQESINRVKTMSIIHEQLYNYDKYTTINLEQYLPLLLDTICDTYPKVAERLTSDIRVNAILLNVEQAVACGLIINEVVTNAMKYAFDGVDQPQISVQGTQQDQRVTLVVSDNGIGLPTAFSIESAKTLGIQLIGTLTQQLNGEFEVEKSDPQGVRFCLRFSA